MPPCSGLAIVFAEDAPDVSSVDPPNGKILWFHIIYKVQTSFSAQWANLCPLYNQFDPDTGLQ